MSSALSAGLEVLPGYKLIDRLGTGGFGEVWSVEAPGGFTKAVKFVHGVVNGAGPDGRDRADQELRALGRVRELRHPFVLSIERFDVVAGRLTIVMELADRDLDVRLRECQQQGLPGIPRPELIKYAAEIADALDFMNLRHDLQHLDIKPANLFLIGSHIKVADFGLVKDLENHRAQVTGGVTPVYAPPETFEGWISRNSDQYSFGIVLMEMLTGRRPFPGPTARQFMMQHLMTEPDLSPLTESDQPVIARALAKDPAKRWASCAELVDALIASGRAMSKVPELTLAKAEAVTGPTGGSVSEPPSSISGRRDRLEVPTVREVDTRSRSPSGSQLSPLSTGRDRSWDSDTEQVLHHLDATRIDDVLAGTGCPTLVIGMGRIGTGVLRRMELELRRRFGESANWPALRLLPVDCDPSTITTLLAEDRSTVLFENLQLCRLQKPNHYFPRWDELKHLSIWLDPNTLFQITAQGTTNGFRALGRLAFVDNYRRLLARIRGELSALIDPGKQRQIETASGITAGRVRPKVVLVGGMGGGFTSGSFIDMCYLARRALTEAGDPRPDIEGMLLVGVQRGTRAAEQHRVNQFALAQNLLDLVQPDASFRADYGHGPRQKLLAPPTRAIWLLETSGETSLTGVKPPMETGVDLAAGYILAAAIDRAGRRLDDVERARPMPMFRSFGSFSLVHPREAMVRSLAASAGERLVRQWVMEPATGDVSMGRSPEQTPPPSPEHETARDLLADPEYSVGVIAGRLLDSSNRKLEEPVEAQIARLLLRAGRIGKEPAEQRVDKLLDTAELVGMMCGLDWVERRSTAGEEMPFPRAVREAVSAEVDRLLSAPKGLIASILDGGVNRLARIRELLARLLDLLMERIDEESRQNDRLRDKVIKLQQDTCDRCRAMSLPIPRPEGTSAVIEAMERYAGAAIQFKLRSLSVLVLTTLRGRLSDTSRDIVGVRQRLERLADRFREIAAEPVDPTRAGTQPIYPGGYTSFADYQSALGDWLDDERLVELDVVATEALGSLAALSSSGEPLEESVAPLLMDRLTRWIAELTPMVDPATAFVDRHGDSSATMGAELKALADWAEAPLEPMPPRAGEPSGFERLCLASLPAGPASPRIEAMLRQTLEAEAIQTVPDSDRFELMRILASETLPAVLPRSVLEARTAYRTACQGRTSPEVFPELSRT